MFQAGFVMAPFDMTIFVPLHMVATGRGKFKEKNVFNVREFHVDLGKIKALKGVQEK